MDSWSWVMVMGDEGRDERYCTSSRTRKYSSRVVCKREYVHARSALSKKNPDIWAFHSNNSKK